MRKPLGTEDYWLKISSQSIKKEFVFKNNSIIKNCLKCSQSTLRMLNFSFISKGLDLNFK